jgi:hypothetical protein
MAQSLGNVVNGAQVGEQRILLENKADRASLWGTGSNPRVRVEPDLSAADNPPFRGLMEASDTSENR